MALLVVAQRTVKKQDVKTKRSQAFGYCLRVSGSNSIHFSRVKKREIESGFQQLIQSED